MKKKLLFMIHDLGHGGAEKVLVNLVNNLNQSKYDITVMPVFGGGINERFIREGIRLKNCFPAPIPGNSHLMKFLTPKQLYRLLVHENYDIVVSYLEGSSARIISGCVARKTKKICWIHSTLRDKEMATGSFRSFDEAQKCYSSFDKIVCVAESVKDSFNRLFDLSAKLDVIYNTNESAMIQKMSREPIEGGIYKENEFNIIGVGKVDSVKGFDRLARVLRDVLPLCEKKPHIYILGEGSQRLEIEQYLRANRISDYYTFLGYQTNPYRYIAKSELFVCASHSEGFSTAATEALICGVPVLTTDVSGMRELIGNSGAGLIVENSDHGLMHGLLEMLKEHQWEECKINAIERGKLFSTEKTVRDVEELVDSI